MKSFSKIDDFYIKEEEKSSIEKIMPRYYIDHTADIDIAYALRFMQNELNALLGSFLNGGYSYKGYILHPLVKDISKENLINIKRLKRIAAFLNHNGYNFSESLRKYKNKINSRNFASILSSLYQDFYSIRFDGTKSIKKPKCKEFQIGEYKKQDFEYLKPVVELKDFAKKNLRGLLSGFYVHGSIATKDYAKGFSDLDTLAIVSKSAIENPDLMLELRKKLCYSRSFFYRIDPLQHHGSIIISEYEMQNYCQPYFPVVIFNYSRSLLKDRQYKFNARDSHNESIAKMFWFVNYFRRLYIEKKYNLNSYDTKILLHSMTLFPSLYLQAKNRHVYKKYSFHIAKKDFDKHLWQIIDEVSKMRLHWKRIPVLPLVKSMSRLNPILPYQLNYRITGIFKDLKKMNHVDVKHLVDNMYLLSEAAWSNVKNEEI